MGSTQSTGDSVHSFSRSSDPTQKILTMKTMFIVMLAVCAVAFAEEEIADQKADEQFLTAFRYGYPYGGAAYVAPTAAYVAPTVKYVAPATAPVHVRYAAGLPAYSYGAYPYTAGAYPYAAGAYPSTYIRSAAIAPTTYVAGAYPYAYNYGYPYATVAVAEKKEWILLFATISLHTTTRKIPCKNKYEPSHKKC